MLFNLLQLLLSLIFLVWGANILVTGASSIASHLKISPLIIGLTIVAVGTSAPEAFVSAIAAIQNNPDISLGNAVGSNIVNIGLIIGVCALITPLTVERDSLRQDLPFLLLISFLMSYILAKFGFSNFTGVCALSLMFAFFYMLVRRAKKQARDDIINSEQLESKEQISQAAKLSNLQATGLLLLGLMTLTVSSHFLVSAAVSIAKILGMSDLIIGLTIVAIGTSLPEFATSVTGVLKGEHGIALGNIIGSNIFNLTGVIAPAALLNKQAANPSLFSRDLPVMLAITFGLACLIYLSGILNPKQASVNRLGGILLLLAYLSYSYCLIFN